MRFLHTSDWHLGRLFHNVHLTSDQEYVLLQFLELVRDTKPDAIIVAGDIYDRAVPPADAVEVLDEVLSTLVLELEVPTIVIAGNHDSPERLGFGSRLLRDKGLYIVGSLASGKIPIPLEDRYGQIDVVTLPFAVPEKVREWTGRQDLRGYEEAMRALLENSRVAMTDSRRSIAVAHAFVTGGQESDSERSLSVGGTDQIHASVFEGFDYVALGHLHKAQSLGQGKIRYSGSLLKYSFSELNHQKSVSLVEMDKEGKVTIEEIALRPKRELRAVEGTLEEVLACAERDSKRDDYILAILNDRTPLLNPMAKLRERYPNVLHIERPHFGAATATGIGVREHQKMSPIELFEAFWEQTRTDTLGEKERVVVEAAIDQMNEEGT